MQALNCDFQSSSIRELSFEELELIGGADNAAQAVGTAFGGMSASFAIVAGVMAVIPGGQPAAAITGGIAGVAGGIGWICSQIGGQMA